MNILNELEVEVVRVTVTELRENTFHASITVQHDGAEIEIDSRSSDAIAVAVRAQAPIFAADEVIEESAIEFEGEDVSEEEIVDEFKKFLDRVSAEDFAEAEVEDEEDEPALRRRLSARRRVASAKLLNAQCTSMPGKTLSTRERSQASAKPKIASSGRAWRRPWLRAKAMPDRRGSPPTGPSAASSSEKPSPR